MRLSVFIILALAILDGFSSSAQAQVFGSAEKKVERYYSENLHGYITGLSASELMDCAVEGRLGLEHAITEGRDEEYVSAATDIISAWKSAADVQLAVSGITREEAILNAPLALAVSGKNLDEVVDDIEILQKLMDANEVCTPVMKRAHDSLMGFMRERDNLDAVLAPPSDDPYETEIGNESLTGLFKSVVEWPVAEVRIEAQRCYMISIVPDQYVNGDPLLGSSMRLGYADFMSLEDDALKMKDHFGEILKPMPDNPNSNWPAISEPRNELGAIIRGGTEAQLEMFLDAAKTNMPKCLAMIPGASE